jgi:hypothetical protein
MYHATKASVMVSNAQEEKALGSEWFRMCVLPQYPKLKYHWSGKSITIKNADEETALGGGWSNSLATFEAYKGPRRARTEDQDPCKWVDKWSVPGLSSEHRKKIKAQLLRAESAFERLPDADPESAALTCMRQAYDGIAGVFADAGILTEDLLRKEIPELVWDSAIAGGWWRRASETRQDILPEQRGHYWVWLEDSWDSKELFRAEIRDWKARLLEAPGLPLPAARPSPEAGSSAPSEEDCDFTSEVQRIDAVAACTKFWQCSEAALARTARVDPADLSKWKKGLLSAASDKKARIEKALKNKEAPTPPLKHGRRPLFPA